MFKPIYLHSIHDDNYSIKHSNIQNKYDLLFLLYLMIRILNKDLIRIELGLSNLLFLILKSLNNLIHSFLLLNFHHYLHFHFQF